MDNSLLPFEAAAFQGNKLLASLSDASLQSLSAHLQPLLFHLGATLFDLDGKNDAVYFPQNGIISLVLRSTTGINVEVGLIGPEGVAGVMDAITGNTNSTRGQVQASGSGWRLPVASLRQEFGQNAELRDVLLGYQRTIAKVASQNVLCNRLHSVEQRLSKWLLLAQDRMHTEELELTHEFIATMLGTRRVGVTLAANSLRDAGLIQYRRGFITIVGRADLEDL
ncbi:MAG: Crp/Fnr family transcriptional regulator, partial [Proteobacteria bacterium]